MLDPVPEPAIKRPKLCLTMIVGNHAHSIAKTLDTVAPHIGCWVIVDTGSDDGTQALIRSHLARLGIPGELHQRAWHNLGHNQTEALALAQGHGDYLWVLDADDTLVGTPDFTKLGADIYWLRYGTGPDLRWRAQLFRDGVPVGYQGVTHAYASWENRAYVDVRCDGPYHIESPRLGARDPSSPHAHDRELLLAAIERNPKDASAVFYLAQSYFAAGDFVSAREWFARRVDMGGWAQEVFVAMWRVAEAMAWLGVPWADVQDAYLRAWEFRPTRSEPLWAIAFRCRVDERHLLGYQFAQRAAAIPFPEQDHLFIREDVYAWQATDEEAICASWIGKQAEAFALWRRVLARPDIPEHDRQRIAANCDRCAPAVLHAASSYPTEIVQSLAALGIGERTSEVVVSLVAGPDRKTTEQTLNSFLNCCTDLPLVGRFLALDAGLSAQDRAILRDRYGFLEFAEHQPDQALGAQLAEIRRRVDSRFWLHLGQGWRFFAHENFITRLTAVLRAEPQVFQVGINVTDAVALTRSCAAEHAVRRAPDAGRYVLTNAWAHGPAMFDTGRLDQAGGLVATDPDPITRLGSRAAAAGLRTASLDQVLCIAHTSAGTETDGNDRPDDRADPPLVRQSPRTRFAVLVLATPGYHHSEIFREAAESLHYGLRALGHDSVLTSRLDLDDRRTIVLQPHHLLQFSFEPPKDPIFYNLEPVDDHRWWRWPQLMAMFRRYPVWDYSQANIDRLTAREQVRPSHVPIGYAPELTRIVPVPEDVDVLFYGGITERRRALINELRARGLRVEWPLFTYGADRDAWIARSKIVLNIHQYPGQVFQIVRVSYLLANKRAVVSERLADPSEAHDLESGIAFADYHQLADRCVELVNDEPARRELAERGYQAFSARSQADILYRALSASVD